MDRPPQLDFQPLPNRDAWGVIRGFVYQVDTTLLRWLDLKESEQLALECGEDVDRISPIIDSAEKVEYLLEQIKYRDRNITLRSPEAVEAIASFHAERRLNPDIALHFRFLSNASPGQENPAHPLPARSGILLWSELQRNAISPADIETAVRGIRILLQAVPKSTPTSQLLLGSGCGGGVSTSLSSTPTWKVSLDPGLRYVKANPMGGVTQFQILVSF